MGTTDQEQNNPSAVSVTRWPAYGWLGLALIAVFWSLNWSITGLRTHWLFFPLWLGYCLTVDAWVYRRKGHSMLTRNRSKFLLLFLASVPAWWLFELLNERTQNWSYEGRELIGDVEFALLASLSFSTVMPAVFGTAELSGTFGWIRNFRPGIRLLPTRSIVTGMFSTGCVMLFMLLAWPVFFFPLLWLSVYFILEPINHWIGNRTLLRDSANGDWRPVLALFTGCLICGFFWELWNFYSYPKWIYRIPFFDFLRVFEMPLLGYGGYLPFSLELFALYHLVTGWRKNADKRDFIKLV